MAIDTWCIFKAFAAIYIFLVVLDGAFFFFVMIGAHGIRPKSSAQWWLNLSIQLLTALFTYPALLTIPWRMSNAIHLFCHKGRSIDGRDFYGRSTPLIWFHIPRQKRILIVILFQLNGWFQLINQMARICYPSYEAANAMPGAFWCNAFFVFSFVCGIGGAIKQGKAETALRKAKPAEFDPGPAELIQVIVHRRRSVSH